MLKSIMDNQDNTAVPPQEASESSPPNPPVDPAPSPQPPVDPTPPAQPEPATPPAEPAANLPVAPPVAVGSSEPAAQPVATPASSMSEWPGAFKIYKTSKSAVMLNMGTLLSLIGILLGAYIVYFIILIVTRNIINHFIVELLFDIVIFAYSGSIIYTCVEGVKGNKVTTSEAFSIVTKRGLNIVVALVLTEIITIISIILLIVPFFFVFPRLVLTIYYIVDQDMGPIKAMQASWEHTKGNVGKVYGMIGVFILILLPSITIIGILATLYFGFMYYAAYAVLYVYIINKQSGASANLTPPAAPAAPSINPAPSAS
jgi:hypothetical protein